MEGRESALDLDSHFLTQVLELCTWSLYSLGWMEGKGETENITVSFQNHNLEQDIKTNTIKL